MFNGIIYNQGTISKVQSKNNGLNIFIKSKIKVSKKDIGLSIACGGVCLTLVSIKNNISLLILFMSFLLCQVVDEICNKYILFPKWYLPFRRILTLIVVSVLLCSYFIIKSQ